MAVPINTNFNDIEGARRAVVAIVQWLRELEATESAKGASRVGFVDTNSKYSGVDVQSALDDLSTLLP